MFRELATLSSNPLDPIGMADGGIPEDLFAVFVHGYNGHRWRIDPKSAGGGPIAFAYNERVGPPEGYPRAGWCFSKLSPLFGERAIIVCYRCTSTFREAAKAIAHALDTYFLAHGINYSRTVIITHSMGGLLMAKVLGDLLRTSKSSSFLCLPRAMLCLDPPFNGLSETAAIAVERGAVILARRAGGSVATGGTIAVGGIVGAAGIAWGLSALRRGVMTGSWPIAFAGASVTAASALAGLFSATSSDLHRSVADHGSDVAEKLAVGIMSKTRDFIEPVVHPETPENAELLREIRMSVVQLGCLLPVVVLACKTPSQKAEFVTQAAFRPLPTDERAVWEALSARREHLLTIEQVVPQRWRALAPPSEEMSSKGENDVAAASAAGSPVAVAEASLMGSASSSTFVSKNRAASVSDLSTLDNGPSLRLTRTMSDGDLVQLAAKRALEALVEAGEDAAKSEAPTDEPDGETSPLMTPPPVAEPDDIVTRPSSTLRGSLERYIGDSVQWAVHEAIKQSGGDPSPSTCYTSLLSHVMSHSSAFREEEQVAFVREALRLMPLSDPSDRVSNLLPKCRRLMSGVTAVYPLD
jgi:hypothetical protein